MCYIALSLKRRGVTGAGRAAAAPVESLLDRIEKGLAGRESKQPWLSPKRDAFLGTVPLLPTHRAALLKYFVNVLGPKDACSMLDVQHVPKFSRYRNRCQKPSFTRAPAGPLA